MLKKENLKALHLSLISPDFTPTEHLCNEHKRRVEIKRLCVTGIDKKTFL